MPVKSQGNVTVTYNSNAITNYLNQTTINAIVAALDTTHFGGSGATQIAGVATWTIDAGGQWASALNAIINPDVVLPPTTLRTLAVTIGGAVTYTWTSNSFWSNYQIQANDATGLITWSGTLALSGAPAVS